MRKSLLMAAALFLAISCCGPGGAGASTESAVPREGHTLDGQAPPSRDALEAPNPPSPRETSRAFLEQRLAGVPLAPMQKNELIRVFLGEFEQETYLDEPRFAGQVDTLVSIASNRRLSQEQKLRQIKERIGA